MPVALHSIIELFALVIIGLGLALKLRWMGWLTILKHKRTMLKVSIIFINGLALKILVLIIIVIYSKMY
jgi:two pore calcium channel protein 1